MRTRIRWLGAPYIMKSEALKPKAFPKLVWKPGAFTEPLGLLFDYVATKAEGTIYWYFDKRRPMRLGARIFRGGAVLATAIAGMIPLLSEICMRKDATRAIHPLWSAVAIAVAATLVLLDKFWGCSSAWVRYMMEIGRA